MTIIIQKIHCASRFFLLFQLCTTIDLWWWPFSNDIFDGANCAQSFFQCQSVHNTYDQLSIVINNLFYSVLLKWMRLIKNYWFVAINVKFCWGLWAIIFIYHFTHLFFSPHTNCLVIFSISSIVLSFFSSSPYDILPHLTFIL